MKNTALGWFAVALCLSLFVNGCKKDDEEESEPIDITPTKETKAAPANKTEPPPVQDDTPTPPDPATDTPAKPVATGTVKKVDAGATKTDGGKTKPGLPFPVKVPTAMPTVPGLPKIPFPK